MKVFEAGDLIVYNRCIGKVPNKPYHILKDQDSGVEFFCQSAPNYKHALRKVFSICKQHKVFFPAVIDHFIDGTPAAYLLAPPFMDQASPGMIIADSMSSRELIDNKVFLSYSQTFHDDKAISNNGQIIMPLKYEFAVHGRYNHSPHQVLIKRVTQKYNDRGTKKNHKNMDTKLLRTYQDDEQFKKNLNLLENIIENEDKMWWEHIGEIIQSKEYNKFLYTTTLTVGKTKDARANT